jgi:tetratricopeptide (TPR) repeat protein
MITALVSLSLLTAMIVATQSVPTAGELQASFSQGQKFYASGAYDQAIESYQHVVKSSSKYLQMDSVRVAVGEIDAPLQEVAPYQIGNSYLKMAEEAQGRAAKTRIADQREAYLAEARQLLEKAAAFFIKAEEGASSTALQALARSQAVVCWYKMKDYERTIEGARLLLERYPESKQAEKAMYDIGWAYYDMEDYPSSIEAFKALVERFGTGYRSNRALFQLGEAHFKLERYPEAVPYYQRLVDQQRIGQMSEREILLMKREKLAGLVDETALEIAAKSLIRIGVCYEKIGEYDKAAEAFEVVAREFADERRLAEEAYLREADMYYNRGDFDATIAVFYRAIEAAGDPFAKARMQLLLANRYFETDHFPDAVREYDLYRSAYGERAEQVGLAVDGVGLQIARAWLGEARKLSGDEAIETYHRAELELRGTLALFPYSSYAIELKFNLGLVLQQQGGEKRTQQALEFFEEVAQAPEAGGYRQSALFQIARIHHGRQDHEKAITAYHEVIAELGDKPEAHIARFELGIVERDQEDWPTAVEEFLKVGSASPLFSRSRLEAGQLLVRHGELEKAIEVLEEGMGGEASSESMALFNYLLGAAHSQLGDQEGALPYFAAALKGAGPAFAERPAYGRGVALYKLGRYQEAIRDLERMWSDPALAASAPRLLAAAYTSVGQIDGALQTYQKLMLATETPVESAEYLLAQAEISYRQGLYKKVISLSEELMQLAFDEPTLPEGRPYFIREKAFWLVADASLRLENRERVIAQAAAGFAAFPHGYYAPDFLFFGGLAALQLERHEEAATKLNQLLERYPTHSLVGDALYYLGYAYFYQTFFKKAIPIFTRVVEDFPRLSSASDALFRIAECRFNLGLFEEAEQDYRKVIDRYPNSPLREDATYNLAWCLMESATIEEGGEQAAKVVEAFNTYLKRFPKGRHAETARYTLAEISFNQGELERAYELFNQIPEEFPGSTAAKEAQAVLPELREALSYQEYNSAMEVFERAKEQGSAELFRTAIRQFEEVWKHYPETIGGVGAKVNVGVCYQRLKEWKQAVDAFDVIIAAGEKGHPQVTPNVLGFVERRRGTIARKHL